MSQDYYSLLGVDKQAPDREIKRAYYNIARDLHPDKAKTPEEARANAERLAVISKAYNTLKDPQKRAEYDGALKGQRASGPPTGPGAPPPPRTATPSGPATATATPAPAPPRPAAPAPNPAAQTNKVSASDMAASRTLTAQKAFVKGMDLYKNTDYKGALPFFEAAVKNDPDSEPHYHMKLAICLMKTKGSFNRAVEAAERACQMDAYNMEFKFTLVEIYETAGVASKATQVLEDILKWEPDNAKAKLKLSLLKGGTSGSNGGVLAKIFPSIFGKK